MTISASGVREGLLYEQLSSAEQRLDPLIFAAQAFNDAYARSPRHAEELRQWTDRFMESLRFDETVEDKSFATRPACSPTSIGARIRIIAASKVSTSS